jgi:hypothetical protein
MQMEMALHSALESGVWNRLNRSLDIRCRRVEKSASIPLLVVAPTIRWLQQHIETAI